MLRFNPMRSFAKRFVLFVVFCGGAWIAYLYWLRIGQFHSRSLSREFYEVLDRGQHDTFDLRELRTVDWDEVVYWGPYENICDYGIEGFEKGNFSCKSSSDDGECYLLFLRNNGLVGSVPIERNKIDLSSAGLKGRIPKEKAIFKFKEPVGSAVEQVE